MFRVLFTVGVRTGSLTYVFVSCFSFFGTRDANFYSSFFSSSSAGSFTTLLGSIGIHPGTHPVSKDLSNPGVVGTVAEAEVGPKVPVLRVVFSPSHWYGAFSHFFLDYFSYTLR